MNRFQEEELAKLDKAIEDIEKVIHLLDEVQRLSTDDLCLWDTRGSAREAEERARESLERRYVEYMRAVRKKP